VSSIVAVKQKANLLTNKRVSSEAAFAIADLNSKSTLEIGDYIAIAAYEW
jgi:hypothetical protein